MGATTAHTLGRDTTAHTLGRDTTRWLTAFSSYVRGRQALPVAHALTVVTRCGDLTVLVAQESQLRDPQSEV